MLRARWRNRYGPPLVVLGTAALISIAAAPLLSGPLAKAAGFRTAASTACSPSADAVTSAARRRPSGAALAVKPTISSNGEFVGRSLAVSGGGRPLSLALPAESFVGQPEGDALVYTQANPGRSEVHVIDLATGCDSIVARVSGVVRSAVLDPTGTAVYVHSVSAGSRRDAGVSRVAIDGGATSTVVPALADDPRFGPTFGTQLAWSVDGRTLAVQSCGFDECRTRLLDVASGAIAMFDALGQGPLVGVSKRHIVEFRDGHSLPSAVVSIDRSSGTMATLAEVAYAASLKANADGSEIASIDSAAGSIEVQQ
jgi:hypothetical protein